MFVIALGKTKVSGSEELLMRLLDDEQVAPHALIALGRRKSTAAEEKIKALLEHPRTLIRKEARAALKRIERAKKK